MVRYFRKLSKKRISVVDDFGYIASAIGLIMTIPQVLTIWVDKKTDGVSAITWISYSILGIFWIYYGIVHKAKPIIFGNIVGLLLNIAVVVGLLLIR